MESDQFFPEYWPANKLIGILEGVLVKAEDIIGQLKSAQIESLEAPKITGLLTSAQIQEIEAAKIAGQLTNAQISELSATKIIGQLVDSQIAELTAGKIKGLLSSAQIEAIEATKITGQLTSAQIKELEAAKISGQISHAQIAVEAVTAINIAALTITAEKLAVGSVKTEKIEAGAVIASKIAASAITAEKIAAEAVESSKIAALAITTEKIAANAITAGKIAANAVTAEKILAESITSVKIAAGAIVTEKIAAGAITAEKINVKELSSITVNAGTITAGTFKGVTFQTTDSRTTINNEGINLIAPKTGEAGPTNRIEWWKEKIKGTLVAELTTFLSESGGTTTTQLATNAPIEEGAVISKIVAGGSVGEISIIEEVAKALRKLYIEVRDSVNEYKKTILDSQERSNFVQLPTAEKYFLPQVGCCVTDSTEQEVKNETDTALTWNTEEYDEGGCHETAANSSRFTVPAGQGGKWELVASFWWEAKSAAGRRTVYVRVNGNTNQRVAVADVSGNCASQQVTMLKNLNAGDYVEVVVWQSTGVTEKIRKDTYGTSFTTKRATFERIR